MEEEEQKQPAKVEVQPSAAASANEAAEKPETFQKNVAGEANA